jgi:hypothetical protein
MGALGGVLIAIFIARLLFGSVKVPTILLVCAAKFLLFVTAIAIVEGSQAPAGGALEAIAFGLIWTPTIVLRWIVVPLRIPRVAYWTVKLCWPLGYVKEIRAGGVVYGALALARKGASDEAALWLERRLHGVERMRGAGVVAAGLLAALRKDSDLVRHLLSMADRIDPGLISPPARTIARDWLVVDAARVGNWHRVIRLGRRRTISLRWSHSMARIGERLTGDPQAWRDWQLWPCFLWAPRRRATYPLFRRALAVPVRRSKQSTAPPADATLPLALGELARAIADASAQDGEALARSIAAVDRSLDSMRDEIQQRLNALGGRGDADIILSDFRRRMIELVTPLIEDNPHLARAAHRGSIMEQTAWQVRRRLFGDIEARCRDYRERTAATSSLDLITEWQAWAMLKGSAEQLLELDPDVERVLFQTVYASLCNFAVFQHNGRKRIALAHDMFIWLLRHCRNDSQARELLAKNVRVGMAAV